MLVITQSLVLDAVETEPDHPLIGWHTVVTPASLTASSAQAAYPVTNLANASTHRLWWATAAADQTVEIASDGVTLYDYIGVARHNFGSAQIAVATDYWDGATWKSLTSAVLLSDDTPVLFRFPLRAAAKFRLRMIAGLAAPRAAVLYLGKLLIMQKRIWSGHVPLPYGRRRTISNGMSESGQYLGRIQLGGWRETLAAFRLLTPTWVREHMDSFLAQDPVSPFFFAWRPDSYPREVGYGVLTNDPEPVNQDSGSGNLTAIDLQIRGVA